MRARLEKALYTRREFLGLICTAASAYALGGCLGGLKGIARFTGVS